MEQITIADPSPTAVTNWGLRADLAPPTQPLIPVFPLEVHDTSLVLYAGAADDVRVRWFLRANDVARAGADFASTEGRPQLVLRLRRVHNDGQSEPAAEIRLLRARTGGEGEVRFRVGRAGAGFEAELGLANAAGGWLLLVRSGLFEHAPGIGLPFTLCTDSQAPATDPAPDAPDQLSALAPAAATPHQTTCFAPAPPRSAEMIPVIDATAASPVSAQTPDQPAEHAFDQSAIPLLVYGHPVTTASGLVLNAELRIHGQATPNTVIDLFGYPYRVGPGGRFQFTLKVDDPALLQQAVRRHPPPELTSPHKD